MATAQKAARTRRTFTVDPVLLDVLRKARIRRVGDFFDYDGDGTADAPTVRKALRDVYPVIERVAHHDLYFAALPERAQRNVLSLIGDQLPVTASLLGKVSGLTVAKSMALPAGISLAIETGCTPGLNPILAALVMQEQQAANGVHISLKLDGDVEFVWRPDGTVTRRGKVTAKITVRGLKQKVTILGREVEIELPPIEIEIEYDVETGEFKVKFKVATK